MFRFGQIGISDVRILTSLEVGTALQKMSPELKVYTDTDSTPKLFRRLKSLSVVLLGPGMGPTEYILNNVIKGVVNHCRKNEIPLIVDLDEWFYAPMFISNIGVFPKSGITFLTNRKEFEKLYEGIKKPDGNDSKINIDDTKFGSNIYILRKACKDRGITVDKQLTWLSSELGSAKRSVGQGHLLAGAVGAYYVFASKNNPGVGGMRIAAIATYAASAHVRDCTSRAFIEHQKGMITSDILEQMKRHYKK